MAKRYYPDAVQILDFYHVSEYVWNVAKAAWPEKKTSQKRWVRVQLKKLKESRWKEVIEKLKKFSSPSGALQEAIESLERYLVNNEERIDYKYYLDQGYMIGSGVIESSNKRVVTHRLKGSGMRWSVQGANSIMLLRTLYLSDSDQWNDFWKSRAA